MRIVIDVELCFSNPTGMGQFARQIIGQLASLDSTNSYYLFHSGNYARPDYGWLPPLPDNFEVVRLPWPRKVLVILSLIAKGSRYLKPYFPSKVDLYFSPSAFLLPIQAKRKVGMIHDLSPFDCPTYFPWLEMIISRRSYSVLVETADDILTVSEFSRQRIIDHWGLPPERVGVIRGGVWPCNLLNDANDVELRPDVPAKYGIDGPYFLWCGAMGKRKNVSALVEALHEFRRRTNNEALLVLAGTRGNESRAVDQLAHSLCLRQYIRKLGYVTDDELHALLEGATAFVFPSLYEGFGLPVLEAMACGTPVIASDMTSLPEVVGEAGLLVDPLDPSSIAQAMEDVVMNPDLRRRLSQLGKARSAMYTWKNSAEALLRFFNGA